MHKTIYKFCITTHFCCTTAQKESRRVENADARSDLKPIYPASPTGGKEKSFT